MNEKLPRLTTNVMLHPGQTTCLVTRPNKLSFRSTKAGSGWPSCIISFQIWQDGRGLVNQPYSGWERKTEFMWYYKRTVIMMCCIDIQKTARDIDALFHGKCKVSMYCLDVVTATKQQTGSTAFFQGQPMWAGARSFHNTLHITSPTVSTFIVTVTWKSYLWAQNFKFWWFSPTI